MNTWNKTAQDIFTGNNFKKGLNDKEVQKNLERFGLNKLPQKKRSLLKMFLSQFANFLIGILFVALVISCLIPFLEHERTLTIMDFADAIVITSVLLLNGLFGFWQEFKIEKEIETLARLSSPKTKVWRNGTVNIINSEELVPSDIILFEEGDQISADARIFEATDVLVNESLLTGESAAVNKNTASIKGDNLPLADLSNLLFAGTQIVQGHGRAIVFATNTHTEIGKIAQMVSNSQELETPLQKKMKDLSKILGKVILVICALIVIFGFYFDKSFVDIFMLAVALAVSAVPEGLPAVITISLAIGAKKMLKKNVLVRKLASIETLGTINVICSDKTGTITKNQMEVEQFYCDEKVFKVGTKSSSLNKLAEIAFNCNAIVSRNIGDPTELALYSFADKVGSTAYEKIDEIPFSSSSKMMSTLHQVGNLTLNLSKGKTVIKNRRVTHENLEIFKKGAIEAILPECSEILIKGKVSNLSTNEKHKILKLAENLAAKNYRILAFSYKKTSHKTIGKKEREFVFVGFACLMDPPRDSVKQSITEAKQAGIRTIMITGDNLITAQAIGKSVGIEGQAMEGKDLEELNQTELQKVLQTHSVFARVNPEHKLRILQALQAEEKMVVMTGDGVNDAPALKNANAGIAMGKNGTDTARAASDIVLLSDSFSDITRGIFTGRTIDDNIKKFVVFLLACNFKEVILVIITILFNLPLPFLPIHILWLNLATDSFPALTLALEKPEKGIKSRPPRDIHEGIFAGKKSYIIFATIFGLLGIFSTFTLFSKGLSDFDNLAHIQTAVLLQAVLIEMLFIFSVRTNKFAFNKNFFANKYLHMSVILVIFMQFMLMFTPLANFFHLTTLNFWEIIIIFIIALVVFFALEGVKSMERNLKKV